MKVGLEMPDMESSITGDNSCGSGDTFSEVVLLNLSKVVKTVEKRALLLLRCIAVLAFMFVEAIFDDNILLGV